LDKTLYNTSERIPGVSLFNHQNSTITAKFHTNIMMLPRHSQIDLLLQSLL